jgi:hypothetical protein
MCFESSAAEASLIVGTQSQIEEQQFRNQKRDCEIEGRRLSWGFARSAASYEL